MLPRVFMRTVLCLRLKVAYNLLTLRKPAGIVLSLLFLALSVLEAPLQAQQQTGPARVSRLLLIIPFENTSNAAGTDWISESFPEVLNTRLSPSGLFVMGRDDRLNAFDRLGISPTADAYLVMARLDLAENKSASAAQNVDRALALDPANAAAIALKRDISSGVEGKVTSQHP